MATCNFERDCKTIPFPAKCVKFCMYQILGNISLEEKKLILGLEQNLATTIFQAFNEFNVQSFDELEQRLQSSDVGILLGKFNGITQFQLNYFNLPMSERQQIIDAIKRLNLDSEEGLFGNAFA